MTTPNHENQPVQFIIGNAAFPATLIEREEHLASGIEQTDMAAQRTEARQSMKLVAWLLFILFAWLLFILAGMIFGVIILLNQ
jgi:hypothetical protein